MPRINIFINDFNLKCQRLQTTIMLCMRVVCNAKLQKFCHVFSLSDVQLEIFEGLI